MILRSPVISVNSPIQIADYAPGATYGPRRLPNFELLWILHGSALWRTEVYDDAGVRQATVEHELRLQQSVPLLAPVLAGVR